MSRMPAAEAASESAGDPDMPVIPSESLARARGPASLSPSRYASLSDLLADASRLGETPSRTRPPSQLEHFPSEARVE
jgi:hypothetical protein